MLEELLNSCSFCGSEGSDTNTLIVSDFTAICAHCSASCQELLRNHEKDKIYLSYSNSLKKPKDIKIYLDRFVIGQDNAKKILSVAIYNHYKRLAINEANKNNLIKKSNILILGPTGTGKSYLIEKIAEFLELPFVITDSNAYTEAGYVGRDVNAIFRDLYNNADKDISKAQKGIVYIDEIDKLGSSGGRKGSGSVQAHLLKLVEGDVVDFPVSSVHVGGKNSDDLSIDTTNILFIIGGAFTNIINDLKKKESKSSIGFHASNEKEEKSGLYEKLTDEILIDNGFLLEFIGRFPVKACLNDLEKEDLVGILKDSEDSIIKQFQALFEFDNKKLEFTDKALDKIAKKALKLKKGARALRSVVEENLQDLMFDTPEDEIIEIDEEMIK